MLFPQEILVVVVRMCRKCPGVCYLAHGGGSPVPDDANQDLVIGRTSNAAPGDRLFRPSSPFEDGEHEAGATRGKATQPAAGDVHHDPRLARAATVGEILLRERSPGFRHATIGQSQGHERFMNALQRDNAMLVLVPALGSI